MRKKILRKNEVEFKEIFKEDVADGIICCEICGLYSLIHPHRMKPGSWGGLYDGMNVSALCPTHHFAIHFLMNWFRRGKLVGNSGQAKLLDQLKADERIWKFWKIEVLPICVEKMTGKRPPVYETY